MNKTGTKQRQNRDKWNIRLLKQYDGKKSESKKTGYHQCYSRGNPVQFKPETH